VSISLASASAIIVSITQWPLSIAIGIYLLYKGIWIKSVFSILYPLLSFIVSFPYAGGKRGIGDYEIMFMRKMGYDVPEII